MSSNPPPGSTDRRTEPIPPETSPYGQTSSTPPPAKARTTQSRLVRSILEFVGIVAAAIIIAYFMQAFVAKPFEIPTGSMEPTLVPGDRVLVNRLAYKYGDIQRGDIIVFKSPNDPNVDFIKRVIAIGGDSIEVRKGQVLVNGEPQVEDYVHVNDVSTFHYNLVPQGMLFVMGDNRTDSQDSRLWKVPWLPEESVIGKAFMIYWPPTRIGRLH
jgi:signal peptidase I